MSKAKRERSAGARNDRRLEAWLCRAMEGAVHEHWRDVKLWGIYERIYIRRSERVVRSSGLRPTYPSDGVQRLLRRRAKGWQWGSTSGVLSMMKADERARRWW